LVQVVMHNVSFLAISGGQAK